MTTQLSTLSPIVTIHNGKVTTTSLDIAKCFIKRHDNVLRCISNLDCSSEFTALNFELSTYTDCTGRNLPVYNITRDGFVFLVTGFTGKKAAQFKEAYINAFNEMEKQLQIATKPIEQTHHITLTDNELYNLAWLYKAADHMLGSITNITPSLYAIKSEHADLFNTMAQEHKWVIADAKKIIINITKHINQDNFKWRTVLPKLRNQF